MITIGNSDATTTVLTSAPRPEAVPAQQALYTHVGHLPFSVRDGERSNVHHAATYQRGRYGWDYPTLCGKTLHLEGVSPVSLATHAVTCKKCLAAIKRAEKGK